MTTLASKPAESRTALMLESAPIFGAAFAGLGFGLHRLLFGRFSAPDIVIDTAAGYLVIAGVMLFMVSGIGWMMAGRGLAGSVLLVSRFVFFGFFLGAPDTSTWLTGLALSLAIAMASVALLARRMARAGIVSVSVTPAR